MWGSLFVELATVVYKIDRYIILKELVNNKKFRKRGLND